MNALIRPFLSICLMRLGPQDLPCSQLLLSVALGAHVFVMIAGSAFGIPLGRAVLAGVVQTTLLVALTSSLLLALDHKKRLVQTLTAVAGADALISFVALPIFSVLPDASGAAQGETPGALARIAVIAIVGWDVAVIAHVLRHALSVGFAIALVLSVIFFAISLSVMDAVYKAGLAPTG